MNGAFVAIDSNIVDLLLDCERSQAHVDAMEAMEEPPPFDGVDPKLRRELWACCWLRALARVWPDVLYTFSDVLYAEKVRADRATWLVGFAMEIREDHPASARTVDPRRAPGAHAVMMLGVKRADAEHVCGAIGMGCNVFLTNDRRLRNKSDLIEDRWSLRLRRPSEFLIQAVKHDGASWPTGVPWPWELIDDV